ncbi:hypothetical protein LOTGIDRAFT_155639 [Lottia gigantea]|uniref:Uncharacterized protein n=1 Tax=Lottia gigantea TaxID=225164 RepID=V3YX33_LOTGI|nr:hypothetical protein LOTGIDRAFT_155639 [Lottia gigantea]ESO82623.1 hypothetical protein LOTGIDRAFT_155639 [Lottia gigantea]
MADCPQEIWTQRDQFTHEQIPVSDKDRISSQNSARLSNHHYSTKSKAGTNCIRATYILQIGDIVYLQSDRNKSCSRSRYLVTNIDGSWCDIRKFIGSQLRNTTYRVQSSELYKVHSDITGQNSDLPNLHEDDDDSNDGKADDAQSGLHADPPRINALYKPYDYPPHSLPLEQFQPTIDIPPIPDPPPEIITPPQDVHKKKGNSQRVKFLVICCVTGAE